MIIWINGPYGVGKSTLAEKLAQLLPESFLFDAEKVGDAVRDNLPERFFRETYEEYPLWYDLCCRLLGELNEVYDGCVLVPMTLKRPVSQQLLFDRLTVTGVPVKHVLLEADRATVRERILRRGEEEDCWCMQNIEACLSAQREMQCDLRLQTDGKTVEELAQQVVRAFGLEAKM